MSLASEGGGGQIVGAQIYIDNVKLYPPDILSRNCGPVQIYSFREI